MKEKKGKFIFIAMVLIILALICFNGYLLYDKMNNNVNNTDNYDSDNILNVYMSNFLAEEGSYFCDNSNKCYDISNNLAIKTESPNSKVVGIYNGGQGKGYVLYIDNGLKLFNLETKKSRTINLDVDSNSQYIYFYALKSGFIYDDGSGHNGYYNIETNNVSIKNKYLGLKVVKNSDKYLVADGEESTKIIDLNTEKVILERKIGKGYHEAIEMVTECYEYENETFFVTSLIEFDDFKENYIIYNKDGKVVTKLAENENYEFENIGQFYNRDGLIIYKENRTYLVD